MKQKKTMEGNQQENAEKQQKNSEKRVIGRPFPKGVSGNPNGRPKGITLRETARIRLEDPKEREAFIERMIKEYPTLVWQMIEGRPAQQIDLGNTGDLPFNINIVKDGGDKGADNQAIPKTV